MNHDLNKPDYGSWASVNMVKALSAVLIAAVVLLLVSFSGFTAVFPRLPVFIIRAILILLCAFTAFLLAYIYACIVLFSYDGNYKIQSRVLDYVLDHVEFNEGSILDIGCGSGALSIKVAKKFPLAHITGIDYWDPLWNYAKEQCERNAVLEGVSDRITFLKGDAAKLDYPDECFDGAISNFVFHEVKSEPDKRRLVKEALRVVKKGGIFAFHDLFLEEHFYGNIEELMLDLKRAGLQEIHFLRSVDEEFIPKILKTPFMLGKIGLIYGIK